jgi:hypothetical protein
MVRIAGAVNMAAFVTFPVAVIYLDIYDAHFLSLSSKLRVTTSLSSYPS